MSDFICGFKKGDTIEHTSMSGRVSGGVVTRFLIVSQGTWAKYKSAKGTGQIQISGEAPFDGTGIRKVS